MHLFPKIVFVALALIAANTSIAQDTESVDDKVTVQLDGLISSVRVLTDEPVPFVRWRILPVSVAFDCPS